MFWSTVVSLLRTILYGWLVSLYRILVALLRRRRQPDGGQPDCVPFDHPAVVRPDPLVYSQEALTAQGLAVTWDNPDITLFLGGAPVDSGSLLPATTYEVQVRVWNNSLNAPVVGMPVHLSYLDFGVGTQLIGVASGTVDVGVKGSASQPGFVSIPWTTPATLGHYCLQALLDPADDTDRSNNLGQENTNVVQAQSPATFTFTLRNNTRRTRTYRFEVDAYELPGRPPCSDEAPDRGALVDRHRRGAHPVPAGFTVQVTPSSPTIDPGFDTSITVTVDPPPGFTGRQAINVNAFHDHGFAGGVTLTTVKGS